MLFVFFGLAVLTIVVSMFWAGLAGAPWVPTFSQAAKASIDLAQIKKGEIVYDLGCGDGRWLTRAAKFTEAKDLIGFEISFLPYILAKLNFLFNSERKRLHVKWQNYFKIDLSQADVIYCFGLPGVMSRLEPKLIKELKPGARLVSYVFKLPYKQSDKVVKLGDSSSSLYLYIF